MAYGSHLLAGAQLWQTTDPLLLANSPLVSPWINTEGFSAVLPWFSFAGGTSTHSIEGSFDGATADPDFGYAAPVSGTAFDVRSPFIRWRTVQTVANATKSKITLRAK